MEKSNLDKGQELRSYQVGELSEHGIIPRLMVITAKDFPDEVELSTEIIAELRQCCQVGELPYVIASVENGKAVPFEYRQR